MVKKNIMYVTHSSEKGGAEQSLIHLINQTDLTKYNIFILCPKRTKYLNEIVVNFKEYNMDLQSIKKNYGLGYINRVLQICKLVKDLKIDIVHANGWRAPWYIAPLKYLSNVKIIWHHRDLMESKFYNEILPKFFDHIICISEYVKSSLVLNEEKKCSVVYNGVDFNSLNSVHTNRNKHVDGEFVIGAFGRIVEWKRFDHMIKAVKIFADRVGKDDWKFNIVGGTSVDGSETYYNYLKSLVQTYGLQENIHFLGHQNNPLQLMSDCDVTINFSDHEPFGRVIIESLFVKTPAIVADSGGAPEIIRLTNGGYICEDGNIDQLAQKLYEMYHLDEVDYKDLLKNGYTNVENSFNMKKLYNQVDYIYQSLLQK